jgi:hypothetical protein
MASQGILHRFSKSVVKAKRFVLGKSVYIGGMVLCVQEEMSAHMKVLGICAPAEVATMVTRFCG